MSYANIKYDKGVISEGKTYKKKLAARWNNFIFKMNAANNMYFITSSLRLNNNMILPPEGGVTLGPHDSDGAALQHVEVHRIQSSLS